MYLFLLNQDSGILQFAIDPTNGTLSKPTQTSSVLNPRSLAFRYA